jgi:hypothetical protein
MRTGQALRLCEREIKLRRRKEPYSDIGIKRVPCARCGKPSSFQWKICSSESWEGLCKECDVLLNALVLKFMRDKNMGRKITEYIVRVYGAS